MKNFQSKATEQGEKWHQDCIAALKRNGFEIKNEKMKLDDVGIQLDAVTNNECGLAMAWEFKGSWEGDRPGLTRTDTLKKAVANAWFLSQSEDYSARFPPLFVMTTHEPEDGSCVMMMHTALSKGLITYITNDRDHEFLKWLLYADDDLIYELIEMNRKRVAPDPFARRPRRFPRPKAGAQRARRKVIARNGVLRIEPEQPVLFALDSPNGCSSMDENGDIP